MSEKDPSRVSVSVDPKYAWRKRPRKFTSKSRKGCKTCKVRRIKCDMDRPYCRRCVSTGRKCDGYMHESATTPIPVASHVPDDSGVLLQDCQPPDTPLYSVEHIAASLGCPLHLPPAEAEESSALSFFDLKTLPGLNGCRRSPSWTRTLIYFANTVHCVRHAAVAVGALHQAYTSREKATGALYGGGYIGGGNVTKFALHHYNLAISHLLKYSGNSSNGPRHTFVTLIVCYLFNCFDNISGNHPQAFRHLKSGITLLIESREALKRSKGVQMSNDQDLLKQITEQFRHLDAQAASFLLGWSRQLQLDDDANEAKKPNVSIGPADIRFSSLFEAANQLEGIIPKVIELRRWETESISQNQVGVKETDPATVAALRQFLRRQAELVCQLEEWSIAFAMLLPEDIEKACAWDGHLIRMLQLHYMTTFTILNAPAGQGEMACDGSLPQFRKIVALASIMSNKCSSKSDACVRRETDWEPGFTLEMVLIPAVYIVGMKCRDPSVRREIISMLRRHPRREGAWDSITAAKILERMMEIEEGEEAKDFELGLKSSADIPFARRITEVYWGPYGGHFESTGNCMTVHYKFPPSNGKKRSFVENLVL